MQLTLTENENTILAITLIAFGCYLFHKGWQNHKQWKAELQAGFHTIISELTKVKGENVKLKEELKQLKTPSATKQN